MLGSFDVVVIGAGHAGIEAAVASAKLGASTALFTLSLDGVANMPCNPAIGGTAKGHLVREIDALGGVMAKAADATLLQGRMLNKTKGSAVQSLRAQNDRSAYHIYMKQLVESTENLQLKQAEIVDIDVVDGAVVGVYTNLGGYYATKAVVVATGTYLHGLIYIGEVALSSGPDGQHASMRLRECFNRLGITLKRFKTGTPARVKRASINYSLLQEQCGDEPVIPFSFDTNYRLTNVVNCHIAFTNEVGHEIIRNNIHRSPLYGGKIEGVGPRYCPSIEDKVVRFADKQRHQLFVEPCGLNTEEMYLQGMSSSLPEDVQNAFYKSIIGFENVEIMRPAYAIEYDCCDPTQLDSTLQCKTVKGLFGAGQFNGTSGYEEAAAQGLVAGVNAASLVLEKPKFTLTRENSYIGTLIDDLITKGVLDPYRMMTSRSEYRLYLRQDNADERLSEIGFSIGLLSQQSYDSFKQRRLQRERLLRLLNTTVVGKEAAAELLERLGTAQLTSAVSLATLLKRPEIVFDDIAELLAEKFPYFVSHYAETELKYEGYLKRAYLKIAAAKRNELKEITADICYENMQNIRLEAREKLQKVMPKTLAQAARIPGVTPADIGVLELYLKTRGVK